jgi:hypothetical protein
MLGRVPEISLAVYGFALNLLWEFGHTPLYLDASGSAGYLLWTRLHCTLGDVMILLASFWITVLVSRSRRWWRAPRPWMWAAFIVSGLAYTFFSEWLNTVVRGSWAYAPSMPLLFGLGLTPLLQWLIVPVLSIKALQCAASRPPHQLAASLQGDWHPGAGPG